MRELFKKIYDFVLLYIFLSWRHERKLLEEANKNQRIQFWKSLGNCEKKAGE
jgi:hypothetical protein